MRADTTTAGRLHILLSRLYACHSLLVTDVYGLFSHQGCTGSAAGAAAVHFNIVLQVGQSRAAHVTSPAHFNYQSWVYHDTLRQPLKATCFLRATMAWKPPRVTPRRGWSISTRLQLAMQLAVGMLLCSLVVMVA